MNKKILSISDSITASTGYGRISYGLLKQLKSKDYDVYSGAFQFTGRPAFYDNIPIYDCAGIREMERTIDEIKPDYVLHTRDAWVHTNRYYNNVPYNLKPACERVGAKAIYSSPVQAKPLPKPLIDQVNPQCDFMLTMSDWGKWAYIEKGWPANKIDYLYHGIDPEIYKPLDKKECRAYFGFPQDEPLLLYVGLNIDYRKNLGTALLVLKEVLKEFPNANLCLWTEVNSGGAILEDWAESHGVRGHLYFPHNQSKTNGVTDKEMAMLYNSADCYTHTSTAEGFGMPLLEARACGIPIVATDQAVLREIHKDYIDYAQSYNFYPTLIGALEVLVNPFDMAQRVIQRLKNPDPERLAKGIEEARSNFTWQKIGDKLDSILNSLGKA
jgi:glycosyltransferase involved in cell wall biosynthesis